ncbi:hypothetical protein D3C78_1527060 [compost metagenome]
MDWLRSRTRCCSADCASPTAGLSAPKVVQGIAWVFSMNVPSCSQKRFCMAVYFSATMGIPAIACSMAAGVSSNANPCVPNSSIPSDTPSKNGDFRTTAGQPHKIASRAMAVDAKQYTRSLLRNSSAISSGVAGHSPVMTVQFAASSGCSFKASTCRPGYNNHPLRCWS